MRHHIMMGTAKAAEARMYGGPDPFAVAVVRELKERLTRRYGDRLAAVYLFGSRARGDHRPGSDADVAVFLHGDLPDPYAAQREMIEDAYDLTLERGLVIQPWPMPAESAGRRGTTGFANVRRAVSVDGVLI